MSGKDKRRRENRRAAIKAGTYKGGFEPVKFFRSKGSRGCAVCGKEREAVWITAPVGGELRVFTMCGEICRDRWRSGEEWQ